MISDKERHILEAVVQVLEVAGIKPWFEARIIKDSDKKLNGKRISSKKRTDLASVLAVADKRRVMMLPNMRMELRMYATLGASRSVFMGQEMTGTQADVVIPDEVPPVVVGVDTGRPEGDTTVVMVRQGERMLDLKELVKTGAISDSEAAMRIGVANYSPAKNVERLRGEGLAEDHPLMRQAKRKVVLTPKEEIPHKPAPEPPLVWPRPHPDRPIILEHVCDANGPMRQKETEGPFLTTCSLCGEFNAGST